MAANATVPNSFTNATTADAVQVNANFTALLNWLNTNAVHLDAAKAFTGIPTGPATDPTSANQLTRKSYVDAQIVAQIAAAVLGTANLGANVVTNAKLAQMTTQTFKGRFNAGTGDPEDMSAPQAASILPAGGDLSGTLSNAQIVAGAVGTTELANLAVTNGKLASNAVTDAKVASGQFPSIQGTQLSEYVFSATRSSSQTLSNNTSTFINFQNEETDPSNVFNNTTGSWVCPATGLYHFDCTVVFDNSSSVGYRQVEIRRFNSGLVYQRNIAKNAIPAGDVLGDNSVVNASGAAQLNSGDVVRVHVLQNSGGNLDILSGLGDLSAFSGHCLRLGT